MKRSRMTTAAAVCAAGLAIAASSCKEQAAETGAADSAAVAPKSYPLDVCLVSGEELGSMGEPVSLIHDGQEIKFCCDSCEPKFRKDPAKYLSKLEAP
ncbi:MAG: hypothetical protein Q7R22_007565 [Verrucomicrobiota bacterium JB025]|nr:hypothetical protein [Verrucomicrobiota bacterium JB025]